MATRKQYPLRIDPKIWKAVERWADEEMRSSNAQIEWIVRDALKREGRLPQTGARHMAGADAQELVEAVEA